jgi:hypothetical protein
MDEVWELEGVANEEDWSVVPNQVVDALQHRKTNSQNSLSPPKNFVTMLQSLLKYNSTKIYGNQKGGGTQHIHKKILCNFPLRACNQE